MADVLIRLLASGDCEWYDAASGETGRGTLAAAPPAAAGRRARLLVPGADVLLTRVAVPAGQRARALAAIPWALEDRLAEDVEALHFAPGARAVDGQWAVAVVARRRLDGWLAACAEAGLQPAAVCPEPLALPAPAPDEWVALEEPGRVVVRTGADSGFACEPELLAVITPALAPPARIRRLGGGTLDWPAALAPALAQPEPLIERMRAFQPDEAGIDLLQGEYSRRERIGRQLRRWRVPAALAVAVLVAGAVQFGVAYHRLGAREAQLRADQKALFQHLFPDVQHVRDPRAQLAARLKSLQQAGHHGADFAGLLAQAGDVIAATDGSRLAAVVWHDPSLELRITADNLQIVDRVKRGLADAGLQARLKSAARDENRIDGRIVVEAGKG